MRHALCSIRFVSDVLEKVSQKLIKKAEMQGAPAYRQAGERPEE